MRNRATSHQTSALLTVGLNELSVGIVTGWLTSILGTYSYSEEKKKNDLCLITWLEIIGKISGVTMAAILIDKVGRKSLLSICAITFCLPWLALAILLENSASIFYIVSVIFGIACGINEVSNSAYLGENCSPSNRGILGTIIISAYFLGSLIGFISTIHYGHRKAAIINFIITLLSFVSVFWMVEPVQYLLMKGKYDQAKKNLAWLKDVNDNDQLAPEFEKIRQNVYAEKSKKSSCGKKFTSPANYKSLIIILIIYSLAGMTGYQRKTPFIEYHYHFVYFEQGVEYWSLFLGVQFLIAALSSFIIGRLKRRSAILISFSLISLAQASIATLYWIEQLVSIPNDLRSICGLASDIFFACAVAFSYPILFILRSELFPLSIKGIGSSTSIIVHPVMIYLTENAIAHLGFNEYFSSLLFSACSAILVLFVYFKVPETGNKSLIEIQKSLE